MAIVNGSFKGVIKLTSYFRRTAYASAGLFLLLLLLTLCPIYLVPEVTEAATKNPNPSTLTYNATSSATSVSLTVSDDAGVFASSNSNELASFSLVTNNATGYTLNLKVDGTGDATSLSDGTNAIASITNTSGITASNFSNNTWGLLPSKYNGTANTGDNPNYYPASTTGFKMDETSAANTTANTYTVGLGIKVNHNTPAGTYTNTAVVAEYVANAVTYAIHYYDNAGSEATISGMPSVNPQTGTVAQGTTSTSVNLASAPTRTGYTFSGWCLGDSASVSNITTTNGIDSCSSTVYTAGQSFGIDATVSPDTYYLFAMWTGNEYTATIYYNNKTSSGTSGATPSITSNNTAKCRVTSVAGTSCTIIDANIPSAVRSSVGQYNNAYVGLATATGTMSSSTNITLSSNANFYAVYRTSVTLYYPSSTSARTSKTLYRNQWLTSTSAMSTTVLSDSTTGTSNYSPSTPVTNYSIAGYSASASTNTSSYAAVSNMAANNGTTYYMILSKSVTGTFYYNNNTTPTSGTTSVSSTTKSATQYIRCTSSAAEISNSNYSTPTGSYGTYNNALAGWATSTGTMSTTTPTTANTTFYAVYRTTVTLYKPASTTTRTSVTLYRNQWLTGTGSSNMATTVLSNSTTGTTNYSYSSAISGYTLYGFSASTNTTTRTYTAVSGMAAHNGTTYYAIDYDSDGAVATFYYNNNTNTSSCTTAAVKSTTGTAARYAYTTSSAATTTSGEAISVPSAVSNSKGTCGMAYKNVGTSTSNMTAASSITAGNTYYASYSGSITNYYYNSGYTSRTIYRNQWVTGTATSNMSTIVLSTSGTGTSNYATAGGPGTTASTWAGLATTATTTVAYSSVSAAATASAVYSKLYTIYTFNVTYEKGSNVSSIGTDGTTSCNVTTSSTSCNVKTPSTISANTGYSSNGWSTTKDSSSAGTTPGQNISVSSNNTKIYGNVKKNTYTLTVNFTSNTGVSSVKVCKTSGNCSGTNLMGTVSSSGGTVSSLVYDTAYYLYPSFSSGYEFSAWAKTSGSGTLSATNTSNPTFTIGAGNGTVTVTGKSSCSSTISGTMQGVGSASSYCDGASGTLTDSRDNKTYTVKKIAGALWMTQNLRYLGDTGSAAKTMKIGNNNSNVANKSITLYSLDSSNAGNFGAYANHCDATNSYNYACVYDSSSTTTGVWYNYNAATAGTISTDNNSTTASNSICPAGWRLPSFDTSKPAGSINSISLASQIAPFNPSGGGRYNNGSLNYTDYGFWWTDTARNATERRLMSYDGSSPAIESYNRRYGLFVRCVRST